MDMKGIGVSDGIALDKVIIKRNLEISISEKAENSQDEFNKLEQGIELCEKKLRELYISTFEKMGQEKADIFQAQIMLLKDPQMHERVQTIIHEGATAEWAIRESMNFFVDMLGAIEDDYLKERAIDLKDVFTRLIRIIMNIEDIDFSHFDEEVIVVAKDLTPSDTAQMDKEKVKGFITELGGKTSHSAILARTLCIPAVVGVKNIMESIQEGELVALDGEKGEVCIKPNEEETKKFMERKKHYLEMKKELESLKGLENKTNDGHLIELLVNVGTLEDIPKVLENDVSGIGLFRTEFLYMDRTSFPTEQEQFDVYRQALQQVKGKTVVIRTLDIGGDKEVEYLSLPKEENPYLGNRAIRICLQNRDLFKTQLRAILRASAFGDIKIMFPMISSLEELFDAKKVLEEVKETLKKENICFNEEISVGMMIEVPTAALMSDVFAKEVDFFSIGTNDLVQYMTAVDRGNNQISHLYNPYHPAILKIIKLVVENAYIEGIPVSICGEVASEPDMIPLLVGLGIDKLSMVPSALLKSRKIIRNSNYRELKVIKEELNLCRTAEDVTVLLNQFKKNLY